MSAGMIGAQYGQAGAMFIRLTSVAVLKSSVSTAGFFSMYSNSFAVFFSRISIVHGSSGSSARSPLNGHRKLFLPFMIAMLRGFLFCLRMNLFFV